MDKYLVVITTVLVITQIIRVTQNAISLHRQKVEFKKNLGKLAEWEVKKRILKCKKKNGD